ncbi:MAG: hypothetical protein B9S32_04075 [Verrucomicrobia bacterium Tous-C9LFEB]|nr:MAG: hypothetical protein B9S32_04075 [Verrucomicrobia bacterium Tous-C9LFEB]
MSSRPLLRRLLICAPFLFLLALAFSLHLNHYAQRVEQTVQPGDLVFQKCLSMQGVAIRIATNSQYDHMGIIILRHGKKMVLEALEPVLCTPLAEWVKRTPFTPIAIRRPIRFSSEPFPDLAARLDAAAREFEGKSYDYLMEWSDDRLYCSELVWKLFQRHFQIELCPLQHLRDFNITHPLVARQLKKTYGDAIPLDQTVVSPESVLNSSALQVVTLSRF